MTTQTDTEYMSVALNLARDAAKIGEVPVGAVVVGSSGEIVGQGMNRRESAADPTGHAEIYALREAAQTLGSWRLNGATLFVTLEPCSMCAGALVNSRIDRLVYGCDDPKAGAVRSLYRICDDPRLNHRLTISTGILGTECAALLSGFFADLRRSG